MYYKWSLVQQIFIQILVLLKPLKKGAVRGPCFRNIYSGVNDKFYTDSWKEFKELKSIDKKYYASVKCGTSLRFFGKKGWINEIDPYGWFRWYFRYWKGRRSLDDQKQIGRWKRIVSRFKGILIKLIGEGKDSPKIRQVLLHLGYELEKD